VQNIHRGLVTKYVGVCAPRPIGNNGSSTEAGDLVVVAGGHSWVLPCPVFE
jgi:hypothetical protein